MKVTTIQREHLDILHKFQQAKSCSTEYLTAKALQWFPEYRDIDPAEVEKQITVYLYFNQDTYQADDNGLNLDGN